MRALEKEAQFAAAVEQHRDALYRDCCGYVREDANRQDIYQEVLSHIWRSLETFRGQSSLSTRLYRVAVNTCLSWLRREKRRHDMLERARKEEPTHGRLGGATGESKCAMVTRASSRSAAPGSSCVCAIVGLSDVRRARRCCSFLVLRFWKRGA